MNSSKSIEKYGSLSAVVRELGVERSVARILRASDQSGYDDARPRNVLWGPVDGTAKRRELAVPLAGGRATVGERRAP